MRDEILLGPKKGPNKLKNQFGFIFVVSTYFFIIINFLHLF